MKVIRQHRLNALPKGSVVTIGNFEGLHLGHQTLLDKLVTKSSRVGLPSVVVTFHPNPKQFFSNEESAHRLMTLKDKLRLLNGKGVDIVLLLTFNTNMAKLSSESFVAKYLKDMLNCCYLFVGDDFHFGRNRQGNTRLLQCLGQEYGFEVQSLAPIALNGERVSSTLVREKLSNGKVSDIERLLGRAFSFESKVIHGEKRGRFLGFPTANMVPPSIVLPRYGVYHVRVQGLEQPYSGVANIGTSPSIKSDKLLCEVHLFDCEQDLYGKKLRVEFLSRIRDEVRFESLEELRTQIDEDVQTAKSMALSV